jgi:hypothetical protein
MVLDFIRSRDNIYGPPHAANRSAVKKAWACCKDRSSPSVNVNGKCQRLSTPGDIVQHVPAGTAG